MSIIKELFDLFKNIVDADNNDKNKFKLIITKFIGKCYDNTDYIIKLIKPNRRKIEVSGQKIIIEGVEYDNNSTNITYDKLFEYDYNDYQLINNNYVKFVLLIEKIRNIFLNEDFKNFINYDIDTQKNFRENSKNIIINTNDLISKKIRENDKNYFKQVNNRILKRAINNVEDLTSNERKYILTLNSIKFSEEIDDYIKRINELIKNIDREYKKLFDKIYNKDDNQLLNGNDIFTKNFFINFSKNFINNFIKYIKKQIANDIKENEDIKILFDFFKKTDKDFEFPPLEEIIEDLDKKYADFKEKKATLKKNQILKYSYLFDTNDGEWRNDSKIDNEIKQLKKDYDDLLLKYQPDKIDVNKEYTDLYNYSEKIKEIKEKLNKKEKIQKKELEFIKHFDEYIQAIEDESQHSSEPEFQQQIKLIKEAFSEIKINGKNIKEHVDDEENDGRITNDVISDEEKERNKENVYFEDYISFFKIALKLFTYGGILLAFIGLFLSFVGILILLYDMIVNTFKLFVNSGNSTRNLSLDYISKSIIKCTKNDYSNDRFLILTEQKQNCSIFNLGAYTLYILIFYVIIYFILVFYSNQMSYTFIGSIYDIDEKFIYLFMIGLLIVYSFIHINIFKFVFKPYVYIPYKSIDDEGKNIDEMIDKYILVKTPDNNIVKFNDFFDLLYDASKIDELSEYFLSQIRNEDTEGCLQQKIIIYNLYEYLRQYVYFDDIFKNNFKLYCSNDKDNKPLDDIDEPIRFISMLNNDEVRIISNYHEELDFVNKLEDKNIEFYNKLNTQVSNKIRDINKKIITHNKTTLPFFITIIYLFIIFIFNLIVIYFVVKMILSDKTDAYHIYIKTVSKYMDEYIYKIIINYFFK